MKNQALTMSILLLVLTTSHMGQASAGDDWNGAYLNGDAYNGAGYQGGNLNGDGFNGGGLQGNSLNGDDYNGEAMEGRDRFAEIAAGEPSATSRRGLQMNGIIFTDVHGDDVSPSNSH